MPEKDCAFIQFQNTGDAVVACREMQGARIGNCIVKIAHGKCDIGQMVVMGAAEGIVSRAIWVGNLSQSCKPAELKAMFEKYGSVESARVLPHKTCGFVNFFDIFAAIRAKSEFNSSQVYEHSVAAPIKIRYAKVFIDQPSPVSRSISVASDIGHFVDEEQFTNDAEYLRDFAKPPVNIPDPSMLLYILKIIY
jgi:RNA recognition motif-containing protein